MEIVLTKELKTIFNKFEKNNFEIYLVGGCLRDLLLKKEANDFDLTTNASPQEIKELFKRYKTIDIGAKHGTIIVIINKIEFEITTFRKDCHYSDHRHPDEVKFSTNLKDDLKRRDFTINALAYNPKTGLIDYHKGLKDLDEHVIRCVGKPTKRFEEDGLRILRALRFASSINFQIEEETSSAILQKIDILDYVSSQRIVEELSKLLEAKYCKNILIKYREVFNHILCGLKDIASFSYLSNVEAIQRCQEKFSMRLAILIHNCENYQSIVDSLNLANKVKNEIIFLIEHYYDIIETDQRYLKHCLADYSKDNLIKLIRMQQATLFIDDYTSELLISLINKIIKEKQCYRLKDLSINGADLLERGYQDEAIKNKLDEILKKVIDEQLPNIREVLLQRI